MRLLVITQIMDRTDPTLGFFVPWVAGLAERVERVAVICLKQGRFALPETVTVYSLGKERTRLPRLIARACYIFRFYAHLWRLRGQYDAVFVHMNHEYVLLAGPLWRALGIPVYLWRNHYAGSSWVDRAAGWCRKVFCTSQYSYTARYPHTVLMPVGVDVDSLKLDEPIERDPRQVLSLGRIVSSKRPELFIEALALLRARGVPFRATLAGGFVDEAYRAEIEALIAARELTDDIAVPGAIANTETYRWYRAASVFVNASPSGMLDKTMFKAMAAGALVLSSSKDLAREVPERFVFEDGSAESLAAAIEALLARTPEERAADARLLGTIADQHRLPVLLDRLVAEMA
jgi:glycosyltransferase involved in cell wall biosynthesis